MAAASSFLSEDQFLCSIWAGELFDRGPELPVKAFISEMAAQSRQSAGQKASSRSEEHRANSEEVLCNVCTGTNLRAWKLIRESQV